jgi:hypothetical protein
MEPKKPTTFSFVFPEIEATPEVPGADGERKNEPATRTIPDGLSAIHAELAAIELPKEMMAVEEEIADGSDVVGIEKWRLEFLVRFVLWWQPSSASRLRS